MRSRLPQYMHRPPFAEHLCQPKDRLHIDSEALQKSSVQQNVTVKHRRTSHKTELSLPRTMTVLPVTSTANGRVEIAPFQKTIARQACLAAIGIIYMVPQRTYWIQMTNFCKRPATYPKKSIFAYACATSTPYYSMTDDGGPSLSKQRAVRNEGVSGSKQIELSQNKDTKTDTALNRSKYRWQNERLPHSTTSESGNGRSCKKTATPILSRRRPR